MVLARSKVRIYIAGPYASDPEANTREAMEIGRQLLCAGHAPYIPHLSHYLDLYVEEVTGSRLPAQVYYDLDLIWLAACEAIVMFGRWERSRGAMLEYEFAREHNIPDYCWPANRSALV